VVHFVDSFFPKLKPAQTSCTALYNFIFKVGSGLFKLSSPLTTRLYKRVIDFFFFDISRNSDAIKNGLNGLVAFVLRVLFVYIFFYLNLWGYTFNYIFGDFSESFII